MGVRLRPCVQEQRGWFISISMRMALAGVSMGCSSWRLGRAAARGDWSSAAQSPGHAGTWPCVHWRPRDSPTAPRSPARSHLTRRHLRRPRRRAGRRGGRWWRRPGGASCRQSERTIMGEDHAWKALRQKRSHGVHPFCANHGGRACDYGEDRGVGREATQNRRAAKKLSHPRKKAWRFPRVSLMYTRST